MQVKEQLTVLMQIEKWLMIASNNKSKKRSTLEVLAKN